jgi:AcrR family transcriptional regulator
MASRQPALEPQQERSHATRQQLLDAAVDELLERGYAGLTSTGVALRARVSRGAQQHHFPSKEALVLEAVQHLANRQLTELHAQIQGSPRGRARRERSLDVIFEQFSGPLFAAIVELSLAAHRDDELRRVVQEQERAMSRAIQESSHQIFGEELAADPAFAKRWAMALGTIRGIAMLRLLGHPTAGVDRQWAFARRELVRFLAGE